MLRPLRAAAALLDNVAADYAAVIAYRGKYNAERKSMKQLPVDVVRKIGVQMMVAVRAMQFLRDAGVPIAPQIASRLIRHLYAADVHWDARLAPGVSVIHGQGLVISHAARVAEGCILFHDVTLGEGRDADTERVGSPTLERNVHVGPGAVLLGPITVGEGTKIMAGSVLTESVPPYSLVQPAPTQVTSRAPRRKLPSSRTRAPRPNGAQ